MIENHGNKLKQRSIYNKFMKKKENLAKYVIEALASR